MGSRSVIVIGPDVKEQLGRFRHFEETGWLDHHVVSVDVLALRREEWALRWAERENWYVQDPSGRLHDVFEKSSSGDYAFLGTIAEDEHADTDRSRTLEHALCEEELLGKETLFGEDLVPGKKRRIRVVLEIPQQHRVVRAKYEQFVPFTQWMVEFHGFREVADGCEPDLDGAHKFGWMRLDRSGEVVEAIKRTIPGGFWFYSWSVVEDAWKLKPAAVCKGIPCASDGLPGFTGSACKADIDFDGMRAEIAGEAGACWDEARADPAAFEHILLGGAYDHRWINLPRERYIVAIQDSRFWNCSLIMDGKHIEDASPEFQAAFDEASVSSIAWYAYMNQLIDNLPDDTLLTHVSCRC